MKGNSIEFGLTRAIILRGPGKGRVGTVLDFFGPSLVWLRFDDGWDTLVWLNAIGPEPVGGV